MAALALMILVVAILATGNTRHEVYRSSFGRTGGTVACMIFIFVTYVLLLCWLIVFACCIVMTVFYSLSWGVCNTDEIGWEDGFIDFYPYHFLFPSGKNWFCLYIYIYLCFSFKNINLWDHFWVKTLFSCFSFWAILFSKIMPIFWWTDIHRRIFPPLNMFSWPKILLLRTHYLWNSTILLSF